jgi:hypothetical protein
VSRSRWSRKIRRDRRRAQWRYFRSLGMKLDHEARVAWMPPVIYLDGTLTIRNLRGWRFQGVEGMTRLVLGSTFDARHAVVSAW